MQFPVAIFRVNTIKSIYKVKYDKNYDTLLSNVLLKDV